MHSMTHCVVFAETLVAMSKMPPGHNATLGSRQYATLVLCPIGSNFIWPPIVIGNSVCCCHRYLTWTVLPAWEIFHNTFYVAFCHATTSSSPSGLPSKGVALWATENEFYDPIFLLQIRHPGNTGPGTTLASRIALPAVLCP